mgnify:FL=1
MNAQNAMKAMLRTYNTMKLIELVIKRELTEQEVIVLNETMAICNMMSNHEVAIEFIQKKWKAA